MYLPLLFARSGGLDQQPAHLRTGSKTGRTFVEIGNVMKITPCENTLRTLSSVHISNMNIENNVHWSSIQPMFQTGQVWDTAQLRFNIEQYRFFTHMMTRSAPVSVSPSAPTPVVRSMTRGLPDLQGVLLKAFTRDARSDAPTDPSMRTTPKSLLFLSKKG